MHQAGAEHHEAYTTCPAHVRKLTPSIPDLLYLGGRIQDLWSLSRRDIGIGLRNTAVLPVSWLLFEPIFVADRPRRHLADSDGFAAV